MSGVYWGIVVGLLAMVGTLLVCVVGLSSGVHKDEGEARH